MKKKSRVKRRDNTKAKVAAEPRLPLTKKPLGDPSIAESVDELLAGKMPA